MLSKKHIILIIAILVLAPMLIAGGTVLMPKLIGSMFSSKLVDVPKAELTVHLGYAEQAALLDDIHRFAQQEGFNEINGGQGLKDAKHRPIVNLELTRADGTVVWIVGINVDRSGFSIAIYARRNTAQWQPVAKLLEAELKKRWPGKVETSSKQIE